jgi:uncharacterized membrane protein YccC
MQIVLVFLFGLAIRFAVDCGIACLLQWAILELFHYTVPFWPLVAILFIIGFVFGRSGK